MTQTPTDSYNQPKQISTGMTLDEAIEHAREAGIRLSLDCKTKQCGYEHLQLAKWLQELKDLRKMYDTSCNNDII